MTWVKKDLEATATHYVKKWANLAKSANTALLYLPQRMGGLNIPALTSLYIQTPASVMAVSAAHFWP